MSYHYISDEPNDARNDKTVSATDCSYQHQTDQWQKVATAMNVARYFNILTECSKITFQILKIARRDTESINNFLTTH